MGTELIQDPPLPAKVKFSGKESHFGVATGESKCLGHYS